ncbi:acetylxylan esterase [Saccharothrix sp. MB29]|nr:acetylxylan esterase [Saccharothrix sp. MB29]
MPPSTVYAAYNEITAPKEMAVFPFSGHTTPGCTTSASCAPRAHL